MTTVYRRGLRRHGFTLMEGVLVIAVGLGLIVGGVTLYQNAVFNAEVVEVTTTLLTLSREIQDRYRTPHELWAMDNPDVVAAAVHAASELPPDRLRNVAVYPDGHTVVIDIGEVDPKVCRRVLNGEGEMGSLTTMVDNPAIGRNIVWTECYDGGTRHFLTVGYALKSFAAEDFWPN